MNYENLTMNVALIQRLMASVRREPVKFDVLTAVLQEVDECENR